MLSDIAHVRKEYLTRSLKRSQAHPNPFKQFEQWFEEARQAQLPEPNAMSLATATPDGHPSIRIVLLKGFDESGFLFFTNYQSQKGQELEQNPAAAIAFYWPELERQIRIQGRVEKVSPETSDSYFKSRPLDSQVASIASPQSQPIASRDWLEARMKELEHEATDESIQRPAHWGGYRLIPTHFEFWQGRKSRLHDRLAYDLTPEGWAIARLAP